MKKIMLLLIFVMCFCGVAHSQNPSMGVGNNPCIAMTCTTSVDCPIKAQCDSDYADLENAQNAVELDVQSYQQQVEWPVQQATLQAQLTNDQNNTATIRNLSGIQTGGNVTTSSPSGSGTSTGH